MDQSLEEALEESLKNAIAEVRERIVNEETANAVVRVRSRLHEVLEACVPLLYRIEHGANEVVVSVRLSEDALEQMLREKELKSGEIDMKDAKG